VFALWPRPEPFPTPIAPSLLLISNLRFRAHRSTARRAGIATPQGGARHEFAFMPECYRKQNRLTMNSENLVKTYAIEKERIRRSSRIRREGQWSVAKMKVYPGMLLKTKGENVRVLRYPGMLMKIKKLCRSSGNVYERKWLNESAGCQVSGRGAGCRTLMRGAFDWRCRAGGRAELHSKFRIPNSS